MKQNLYNFNGSWSKTILSLVLFFTISTGALAQTQLVQWDFSNFTNTPTASLPQNAGMMVTAEGQTDPEFVSAAGTPFDPPLIVNGWNVPANTAYFLIHFNTVNYSAINITYFLGAFQFGAKSFQPQFSVASPVGPWIDFGTPVTFPAAGGSQMFANVPLPLLAENQPDVWVRLLSTTSPVSTGGDYIDEITVEGTIMTPLAVSILNFNANTKANQNILNWATETESGNKGFELEYSIDGNQFFTLGNIPSKAVNGNSNTTLEYSFTHNTPISGHNYYRLKQTDLDGRFAYSKVLDVLNTMSNAGVNVYPNPAADVMNVEVSSESSAPLSVTLTDLQGRVVIRKSYDGIAGSNHFVLDTKGLITGIYTLQITRDNSVIHTEKVRKQ